MTHKLSGSNDLPMLEGLSLSDLSDYDVDAGLERFAQSLAEASPVTAPSSRSSKSGWSKLLPWGVGALVVSLGLGVGLRGREDAPAPPPSAAIAPASKATPLLAVPHEVSVNESPELPRGPAPEPSTAVDSSTPPVSKPRPRPSPSPARSKITTAKASAEPARDEESNARSIDELMLAAQMRQALDTRPEKALELARRGQREFPQGMFVKERLAYEALALHALGKRDEAQRRAHRFLERYPKGPQSERVRRAVLDDGIP